MTDAATWRKSSYSGGGANGECVEVGFDEHGCPTAVRDTKDRDAGALTVSPTAWSAFLGSL